jgi:hypothetical protein
VQNGGDLQGQRSELVKEDAIVADTQPELIPRRPKLLHLADTQS